jgi:hypothetical protein
LVLKIHLGKADMADPVAQAFHKAYVHLTHRSTEVTLLADLFQIDDRGLGPDPTFREALLRKRLEHLTARRTAEGGGELTSFMTCSYISLIVYAALLGSRDEEWTCGQIDQRVDIGPHRYLAEDLARDPDASSKVWIVLSSNHFVAGVVKGTRLAQAMETLDKKGDPIPQAVRVSLA